MSFLGDVEFSWGLRFKCNLPETNKRGNPILLLSRVKSKRFISCADRQLQNLSDFLDTPPFDLFYEFAFNPTNLSPKNLRWAVAGLYVSI